MIDNRKLSEEENLWLKSLDNRLDHSRITYIGVKAKNEKKIARLRAFLNVIAQANPQALEEAINMDTALTLDQVFERTCLAARGEAIGEERKAFTIAKNLLNLGVPLETVASATQLDPEKVKALYP